MNMVKALTVDVEKDGWDTSKGFVLRDVPMPTLNESHNPEDKVSVILKIRYAGVCGSDRGLWYRTAFKELVHASLKNEQSTLRINGHEFVGEVVEAGSMVDTLYSDRDLASLLKIKKGSIVSGDSHITCGTCFQCRVGESHVCTNEKILGISTNGIFAEYVKIPAKNLWPIDVNVIRPEIAAILDPFGNAVHATTVTDFRGKIVAVFGCGPIGLFAILLAKNFGASLVIAVDVNEANLKMAGELGAHELIHIGTKEKKNPWEADQDVVSKILKATNGLGVDVSMEMAGPFSSVNNALDSARRGGHVILFGIKDGDLTIPSFSRIIVRGLTIHNVIGRRIFATWQISQRVLADMSNGIQEKIWNIILKKGQGTVIPFAEYDNDVFEKTLNAHPKVVFKING